MCCLKDEVADRVYLLVDLQGLGLSAEVCREMREGGGTETEGPVGGDRERKSFFLLKYYQTRSKKSIEAQNF